LQRPADSRRRNTHSAGNLVEPNPGRPKRSTSPTRRVAISLLASAPLCKSQRSGTLIGPAEAPPSRARSSPKRLAKSSGGQATSNRSGGRHHCGFASDSSLPTGPKHGRASLDLGWIRCDQRPTNMACDAPQLSTNRRLWSETAPVAPDRNPTMYNAMP
jgi:hypothetical protein